MSGAAGASGFGIGPLYLLFLALPGLFFVKSFIYADRKTDTLDRWDKLGTILIGGVSSGIVLLLVYRLIYQAPTIRGETVGQVNILAILVGVGLQSVVATIFGAITGLVNYRCGKDIKNRIDRQLDKISSDVGRSFNDREEPWEYTIDEIREEEVVVITEDGEEIQGIVARYSSGLNRGNLILSPDTSNNRKSLKDGDGDTNAIFVNESSISRVHFQDTEQDTEYADVLPHGDIEREDFEEDPDQKSE